MGGKVGRAGVKGCFYAGLGWELGLTVNEVASQHLLDQEESNIAAHVVNQPTRVSQHKEGGGQRLGDDVNRAQSDDGDERQPSPSVGTRSIEIGALSPHRWVNIFVKSYRRRDHRCRACRD